MLDPGRSADEEPFFDIAPLGTFPHTGSALVVFDSGPLTPANPQGTPLPPLGNLPPTEGQDPHEFPRRTQDARTMKDQFLRVGGRLQTPGAAGASATPTDGPARSDRCVRRRPRRAPAHAR